MTLPASSGVARRHHLVLAMLLLAAFVIRIAAYARFGGIVHPDEVFQYLEQAHRIVFGDGLIPWEYQLGVRSWLFPGFLAGILETARLVGDSPVVQNGAVALVLSLLSLVPVVCGFFWGSRVAGLAGGLLAGGLNAVWSDTVLFSAHPLLDSVGAYCLVGGVFQADRGDRSSSQRTFLLAGLMLGLIAVLRVQLLPAIALSAVLYCHGGIRQRWLPLLGGFIPVVLAQGALDDVTLGTPFQSIWYYVWINQASGVSTAFGVSPWYGYLADLRWQWSFALIPLAICVAAGARRQIRLLTIATSIILVFSCIPHKEMRFIFPAIPLLLTVAGTGSAIVGQRLREWLRWPVPDWLLGVAGLAGWAGLSLLASVNGSVRWSWIEGTGMVTAMHRVAADPQARALGIIPSGYWALTGGYSHLRPGIRLVQFSPPNVEGPVAGVDYVIAEEATTLDPYGMTRQACWQNAKPGRRSDLPVVCLWHNPAGVGDVELPEIRTVMPRSFPMVILKASGTAAQ
jgi:hypothetical protein